MRKRYFHLLRQGNEDLKLPIYVTMTASVLIRDVHKISKRDYSKRNYETKDIEEIGLLSIFDILRNENVYFDRQIRLYMIFSVN